MSGLNPSTTYTFYVVLHGTTPISNKNTATITFILPSVEDLKVTNNDTTITLSWNPPIALAPKRYKIDRSCQGISDSVDANTFVIVSSPPHHSTDVPPYSQCTFDLIGLYGNDSQYLARSKAIIGRVNRSTTTIVYSTTTIVPSTVFPFSSKGGQTAGLIVISILLAISLLINVLLPLIGVFLYRKGAFKGIMNTKEFDKDTQMKVSRVYRTQPVNQEVPSVKQRALAVNQRAPHIPSTKKALPAVKKNAEPLYEPTYENTESLPLPPSPNKIYY